MDVAALVLGITGTLLAALSLGWNITQYRLSGARPELTPIIGADCGGGTLPIEATADVQSALAAIEAESETDPADRILGVTITNKGRADLVITRWSFRSEPTGAEFLPPTDPGCPELPCTIPPGGALTLFTKLARIRFLVATGDILGGGREQSIVATVTSGVRTLTSKPFYSPMLSDGEA